MAGVSPAFAEWDRLCRLSHRVQTAVSCLYVVMEHVEENRQREAVSLVGSLSAWVHVLKACDPLCVVDLAGYIYEHRRGAQL